MSQRLPFDALLGRSSRRTLLRYVLGAGVAAASVPLLAACGGGAKKTPTTAAASGGASGTLKATLTDTSINMTPASITAGSITVEATNTGAMEHELVFIKTDTAEDSLPMDANGDEADEAAAGPSPGEIEQLEPGKMKRATLELTTGTYVVICNITGHYKLGMHATLHVT